MSAKTVDEYIAGLESWQAEVAERVRAIVQDAAPDACEAIKWAQPVWEQRGPFAYMKAFKGSVNFGFWRGVELDDPGAVLQGSGENMRHVKLTGVDSIDGPVLAGFVRRAVMLNEERGDPTKGQ